jgi:hypothetical protein
MQYDCWSKGVSVLTISNWLFGSGDWVAGRQRHRGERVGQLPEVMRHVRISSLYASRTSHCTWHRREDTNPGWRGAEAALKPAALADGNAGPFSSCRRGGTREFL